MMTIAKVSIIEKDGHKFVLSDNILQIEYNANSMTKGFINKMMPKEINDWSIKLRDLILREADKL
jgi:hypothetical protein